MPITTTVSDGFTVGVDTTLTISHTSDANPLYVLLSWYVAAGGTDATDVMDGITYDGVALVRGGRQAVLGQTMEWWRLGTPSVGTADVVLSLNASRRVTAAVLNLSGWPTAIADHTFAADGALTNPPSVDVDSRVGAEVIDWLAFNDEAQDVTIGAGAAELWNQEGESVTPGGTTGDQRSAGSLRSGAAPDVTVSWTGTITSEYWGLAALSFTVTVGRHLVTGYGHSVRGADNVISGRSNTVNADISHAHGEDMTVTGTRSWGINLTDTPRTLADDDTVEIWADAFKFNGVAVGTGATDLDDLTDVVITAPATNDVLQYNGATWANTSISGATIGSLLNVLFVRKPSDESVISSTTLQSDNDLNAAIGASQTWTYRWVLLMDGGTTGDFKYGLNVPSGATGWFSSHRLAVTAATGTDRDIGYDGLDRYGSACGGHDWCRQLRDGDD
jgi:hypothetical protein